jgi:O-antigen/teichoic acid export membrane protein
VECWYKQPDNGLNPTADAKKKQTAYGTKHIIPLLSAMSIRKLAGETAVYGLSSMLGRLLYFLLVPLYVRVFSPAEYGIVADLFSFIGLMLIFFTYRLETAYFRFVSDRDDRSEEVYGTAVLSISFSSIFLAALLVLFRDPISALFQYPEYGYLIGVSGGILALDAIAEIPLSRLRLESRPFVFAGIRLVNIGVNIGANLFFLVLCPYLVKSGQMTWLTDLVYRPEMGIGYIFLSNLLASGVQLLLLSPWLFRQRLSFDTALWRRMMGYSLPLILVGISFAINELLDRKIMIWLLPGSLEENKTMLGAYAACYKLTMIMALFTQAFRYGAEPFFFKQKNEQNARETYATVAHYYGIAAIAGSLFTLLYLDLIKQILHPDYWSALGIIPILLLANLMNGMYYNVSVWYRLKDKTMTGAWIAMAGALATILLNIWWLPVLGFVGAAWATLICYSLMLLLTYFIGQKHYPVPYRVSEFVIYLLVAAGVYALFAVIRLKMQDTMILNMAMASILMLFYMVWIVFKEKIPLRAMASRWRK